MNDTPSVPGLTVEGCRGRQQRLRRHLEQQDLDAALICNPRHVHYFTGYWVRSVFGPVVLIKRDGETTLSAPLPAQNETAADELVIYESNRIGTLVDHQDQVAMETIREQLTGLKRIGCDGPVRPWLVPQAELTDIAPVMLKLRCQKDDDEVGMLRFAIAATEAVYQYAFDALQAGGTEVDFFAGMQAVAAAYVGEAIGEFGNDFQIGSVGSPPRRRACENGEVAIFDLTVVVRGYASDMCRSFVVGRQPTEAQLKARDRVLQVLQHVEQTVRPGVSCRELYETAFQMLDGYEGWVFKHHLGHGIGLCPHEAPRLNPHWDDTFQAGDVFTAEPGLYGPDLKAGLRIEEDYLVTESGVEKLSSFPTHLA